MKRIFALVLGGLGLGALLRRRSRPAPEPSPADDLRAKLAEAKVVPPEPAASEPPATEPEVEAAPGPETEQEPVSEDVTDRRAAVYDRARQAVNELRGELDQSE